MALYDRLHTSSYWRSIVTMAPSCIVFETKRDIGQKLQFFIPHMHSAPPLGSPCWNIAIRFGKEKLNGVVTRWCKKSENKFSCFDTIHERDRQTVHNCVVHALLTHSVARQQN